LPKSLKDENKIKKRNQVECFETFYYTDPKVFKKTRKPPNSLENICNDVGFFKLDVNFVSYSLNEQTLHAKEKDTKTHINFLKT
jgi:hypothetical protein